MTSLGDLPNELLTEIISQLEDPDDIKDFRLICRSCASAPLPFVFERIRLSRLRQDWDAFEQIATQPRLARHVRELVWYELHLEAWTGTDSCTAEDRALDDDNGSYENMKQLLSDAASDPDVFWIPTLTASPGTSDQEQVLRAMPDELRARFLELLGLMPGLTSFTSWPMLLGREVSYKGYPLSMDLFGVKLDPNIPGGNMGFLAFLLPAMEQPKSTIANLRLAEERISLMTFLRPDCTALLHHVKAFALLTSLDLHLNYLLKDDSPIKGGAETLTACLRAAEGLQHLSLRLEAWTIPISLYEEHYLRDSYELFYSHRILDALVGVSNPKPFE